MTIGGKTYDYGKLYWTNDYSSATGVQQKIWYTKDNNGKVKYWLWIGEDNAYQEMTYDSKTKEYKATSNVIYI